MKSVLKLWNLYIQFYFNWILPLNLAYAEFPLNSLEYISLIFQIYEVSGEQRIYDGISWIRDLKLISAHVIFPVFMYILFQVLCQVNGSAKKNNSHFIAILKKQVNVM